MAIPAGSSPSIHPNTSSARVAPGAPSANASTRRPRTEWSIVNRRSRGSVATPCTCALRRMGCVRAVVSLDELTREPHPAAATAAATQATQRIVIHPQYETQARRHSSRELASLLNLANGIALVAIIALAAGLGVTHGLGEILGLLSGIGTGQQLADAAATRMWGATPASN